MSCRFMGSLSPNSNYQMFLCLCAVYTRIEKDVPQRITSTNHDFFVKITFHFAYNLQAAFHLFLSFLSSCFSFIIANRSCPTLLTSFFREYIKNKSPDALDSSTHASVYDPSDGGEWGFVASK